MKKVSFFLGVVLLATQSSWAIISVPRDFPSTSNDSALAGKAQLPSLVAFYQNNVVLIANPDENYSETIQKTAADPELVKQLEATARATGKLNEQALYAAITQLVAANPLRAPEIVASALFILADIPGGLSSENRQAVGEAAIAGIPKNIKEAPLMVARAVGVALRGTEMGNTPSLVRSLRNFALSGFEGEELGDEALTLDQSMISEGILTPYGGDDSALRFARILDQNEQRQAQLQAGTVPPSENFGGFGGSGGGDTPTPTPTPGGSPTPNPTPTPTPTPEPSPVS